MPQADSVHSTPPLNTSAILEANPPPEARADSADSFSPQPAIGQPESQTLTGESRKAAGGLSRRHMLAGLAVLPAIEAGIPASAADPDPIFAALEAFRCAEVEFYADESGDILDEVGDRRSQAADAVIRTQPTTPAGLVALTSFARDMTVRSHHGDAGFGDAQWVPAMVAIDDAARGMSGLKPWAAPTAVRYEQPDTELIELGCEYEPLLEQYYAVDRDWSRSVAEDDRDAASDRTDVVHLQMEPIEFAIRSLPAKSIEGLRAKALVALYEIAPVIAGETEFEFEYSGAFQRLFCAVAEFVGLSDKVAAMGYSMPPLPVLDPDDVLLQHPLLQRLRVIA